MIENENGNYEKTTSSNWPTEGYVFNSELSKCENGAEIYWDDNNKIVVINGTATDKCYVYFDIEQNLSFYISNDNNKETYYFKKNMTWNEWINSDFNTPKLYVSGSSVFCANGANLINSSYFAIETTETITENNTYFCSDGPIK